MNEFILGKSEEVLKTFEENCIDLVVTSPPYDSIRSYNGGVENFQFEKVAVELFRVMKEGGVIVWVVGDQVINKSESGTSFRQALFFKDLGFLLHDTMIYYKSGSPFPARINGNRYTQVFEYMFILSKLKPPKTAHLICDKENTYAGKTARGHTSIRQFDGTLKPRGFHYDENGKKVYDERKIINDFSPRYNIWYYSVGYGNGTADKIAYEHPATFPQKLAEDHILSWSNKGDIVLDPFSGSGTTCKMAYLNDRKYIGIDCIPEYISLSKKRMEKYLKPETDSN